MSQLETTLDLYLGQKVPPLPENWKAVIVKFLPWITLILLILSLPVLLAFFGLSVVLLPASAIAGPTASFNYLIAVIFLAISLILEVMALPGLFKQQRKSWSLLYYSTLTNALYNLLSFNLFGLIIGTLISLYILFQIKKYYK